MKPNLFSFVKCQPKVLFYSSVCNRIGKINLSFYKPILFTFLCFGIDIYPEELAPNKYLRSVLVNLNLLITITTFCMGLNEFLDLQDFSPMSASPIWTSFAGFFLKCLLIIKRREIAQLILLLLRARISNNFKSNIHAKKSMLIFAILLVLLIRSLQFGLGIVAHTTQSLFRRYWKNILISSFQKLGIKTSEYAIHIVYLTNITMYWYHNMYTLSIFTFFYSMVASQMKELVTDFVNAVKISSSTFMEIYHSYEELHYLIETADGTLRYLLLAAVVCASSHLYFSVFFIMEDGMSVTYTNVLAVVSIFFTIFHLFCLIYTAARIPDASNSLQHIILKLPHDSSSYPDKLFLLMKIQQGLKFQLGGFAPINRGIFISLLGTIFTYSLLVKSFPV